MPSIRCLLSIAAMTGMIGDMKPNTAALAKALDEGFITATDLADYLVRKLNMPFREAHHVTGRIVRLAEEKKCTLDKVPLKEMREDRTAFHQRCFLHPRSERAAQSRNSFGGTAPELVIKAALAAEKKYKLRK